MSNEAASATYTGIGSIASDTVSISTSGVERFRIGTAGAIQFGTTATDNIFSSDATNSYLKGSTSVNLQVPAGTTVLSAASAGVSVTGTITATGNITAFSDKKLKENITNINNALQKTLQLRGVYYNRKDNTETRKVGVIAQEVLEVLPEVVMTHVDQTTKEETLTVDYGNIVGLLIEAIKELNEEVQYLKSKIPNQ